MEIAELNQCFGLGETIVFTQGQGNLPLIQVQNTHARAVISLYAAHILSYQPTHAHTDLLFVSEKAHYQMGKSIRGGIPLCWPWFGAHPNDKTLPNHGFARTQLWQVLSTQVLDNGATLIRLGLAANTDTKKFWPYEFKLQLDIIVGDTLKLTLITYNKDQQDFTITQALHSYFTVGEIEQVEVLGFANSVYADKIEQYALKTQMANALTINSEVDRVYKTSPNPILIQDKTLNRCIIINSQGSHSTVIWNPWSEVSAAMADLTKQDYLHFICVETANALEDVITIKSNEHYSLSVEYAITAIE